MPPDQRPPAPADLSALAGGEIRVEGRMPWSSNGTFLVVCELDGEAVPAIYKPARGERPLWDFPGNLWRREVAAYLLSEHIGLGAVPETIQRIDAPLGVGSLQRFVPADFAEHYFSLLENPAHQDQLRMIAAFDLLANNADRKAGHCLLGEDGRIWAIDHGLCFHAAPKLRTVMWDFAGEAIPAAMVEAAAKVASDVPDELARLLEDDEVEALRRRAESLVRRPRFPRARPDGRAYPWPLV